MAMDHAEAHERIADLALDGDVIGRLPDAGTIDAPSAGAGADAGGLAGLRDAAFLAHVRGCPTCRADLAAFRALDAGLRDALGELRDAAAVQPIHPPEALRDAVLEAARREPRVGPAGHRPASARVAASGSGRRSRWSRWLPALSGGQWAAGLAAALVVALLGGLAGRVLGPGIVNPDPSMVAAVATLDRVLSAPDHHLVALTTPSGAATGSVAWSNQDFVVLTSALTTPAPGRVYRCWLEWSGKSVAVGIMDFAGSTAYWTGSAGGWSRLLADPATRFVVTAETAGASATAPTGSVILQASLGT
jgi:Anti-sigma-K factor rskA